MSDHSEGKTLEKFTEKTGIEIKPLMDECVDMITINYRDEICGDDNNDILLLESPLLKEMVHYMRLRVDADIKGEIIENNIADYSRPKMVIISGHDVTMTFQIIYMIKYFGLDIDLYKLPTYTSQIAYELIRTTDDKSNLTYSDYKVFFYFNDDEIFNVSFDKFIDVIDKNSWNLDQINDYCIGKKEDGSNSVFSIEIIVIIILGIICFALLVTVMIMAKMIRKGKGNLDYNKKLVTDGDGDEIKFSSSGRNS